MTWYLHSHFISALKCVLGFNKEKVRLEVNTTAEHLTVTGERQVNEREHVYIDEIFRYQQTQMSIRSLGNLMVRFSM